MYSYARFSLDGHKLFVCWKNVSKNGHSYMLTVSIDGFINFGSGFPTMDSYDPFVTKVWRKRSRVISLFKKTELAGKSKRYIAQINQLKKEYPDKVQEWYDPCFSSVQSFIRQYKKLEGIEYVEKGVDL